MEKIIQKERTVLSCIFDMDTQPNHMYQPVLTIRYNSENEERPIKVIIKHGWDAPVEHSYPLNEKFKKSLETGKWDMIRYFLNSLMPLYVGQGNISEIYISQLGKDLPFCKDHDIVIKNYFQ